MLEMCPWKRNATRFGQHIRMAYDVYPCSKLWRVPGVESPDAFARPRGRAWASRRSRPRSLCLRMSCDELGCSARSCAAVLALKSRAVRSYVRAARSFVSVYTLERSQDGVYTRSAFDTSQSGRSGGLAASCLVRAVSCFDDAAVTLAVCSLMNLLEVHVWYLSEARVPGILTLRIIIV